MKRRSFFHSLALLAGAAATCPDIFIPKFEPVKWKVIRPMPLDPRAYFGKWRFMAEPRYAFKPINTQNMILFLRKAGDAQ